jgi:hypothetical protein
MGGPVGSEQQRLGAGVEAVAAGVEEQAPDRLSHRRAPGLAGEHGVQPGRQPGRLRGLARPLPSLEGDEDRPAH